MSRRFLNNFLQRRGKNHRRGTLKKGRTSSKTAFTGKKKKNPHTREGGEPAARGKFSPTKRKKKTRPTGKKTVYPRVKSSRKKKENGVQQTKGTLLRSKKRRGGELTKEKGKAPSINKKTIHDEGKGKKGEKIIIQERKIYRKKKKEGPLTFLHVPDTGKIGFF